MDGEIILAFWSTMDSDGFNQWRINGSQTFGYNESAVVGGAAVLLSNGV